MIRFSRLVRSGQPTELGALDPPVTNQPAIGRKLVDQRGERSAQPFRERDPERCLRATLAAHPRHAMGDRA